MDICKLIMLFSLGFNGMLLYGAAQDNKLKLEAAALLQEGLWRWRNLPPNCQQAFDQVKP